MLFLYTQWSNIMNDKTFQDKIYRVQISHLIPRKDDSVKTDYCTITMLVYSKANDNLELYNLINKDLSNNHLIVSSPSRALDTVNGTVATIHKDEMCLQHYQGLYQYQRKYMIISETVSITLHGSYYPPKTDVGVHVQVDQWVHDVSGRKVSIDLTLNGKDVTIEGRVKPDRLVDGAEYKVFGIDPCMPHRPRDNYTVVLWSHSEDAYYQVSLNEELLDIMSLTDDVLVHGVNN